MASVGRANMNTANHAAKAVKGELETMQKTLGEIGQAVVREPAASRRRTRRTSLSYDPQLIADLEAIKLDPRPNTATIFRVDYFRLPDADVDKLFNYYYDTIALYNEVERHIRKTDADAESLKAFAEKIGRHRQQELRHRVRQQRRQDHRRQPGRDRRSGLQERRQGLRRRRPDRLQGPLEHRRARGSTGSRAASSISPTSSR